MILGKATGVSERGEPWGIQGRDRGKRKLVRDAGER